MNIMDLHMVPSEKPSSSEEAMHKAETQFLRAAYGSRRGGMGINSIGHSLTMAQLCQVLESGLDRPIIDETHLPGTYAVNVYSGALSTRDFMRVLCEKLGLVVTPARRDLAMLVVRQE